MCFPIAVQNFDDSLPSLDSPQGTGFADFDGTIKSLRLPDACYASLGLYLVPRHHVCTMGLLVAFSYRKGDRSIDRLPAVFGMDTSGPRKFP